MLSDTNRHRDAHVFKSKRLKTMASHEERVLKVKWKLVHILFVSPQPVYTLWMFLFVHFGLINRQSLARVFSMTCCWFGSVLFYILCFLLSFSLSFFVSWILFLFGDTANSRGKNSKMSALKMMQTTLAVNAKGSSKLEDTIIV